MQKEIKTKQPDSKEDLRDGQEWEVSAHHDNNEIVVRDSEGYIVANCECDLSFLETKNQKRIAQANAELIVKAVNERKDLLKQLNDEQILRISGEVALDIIEKQRNELRNERKALLDSHRELLHALKALLLSHYRLSGGFDETNVEKGANTAINNAKNI